MKVFVVVKKNGNIRMDSAYGEPGASKYPAVWKTKRGAKADLDKASERVVQGELFVTELLEEEELGF